MPCLPRAVRRPRRLFAPLLLLLALTPVHAPAQTRAQGTAWLTYFGDHRVGRGSRWSLWFDAQLRRSEWGAEPMQLLLRPGLLYDVSPAVRLGAGYALVTTSPYGPFGGKFTPEHRLWQQVIVRGTAAGRVGWMARTRTEQRIMGFASPTDPDARDWTVIHRLRQQVRVTIPLRARAIRPGDFYLALQDEVFLRAGGGTAGLFDQNRALAALGYELRPGWRAEVGYMNQYLARRNGLQREVNHTLHVALFSTAPF